MNIREFFPGDVIVRVKPVTETVATYDELLGIHKETEVVKDSSYMGEPFKLCGFANGIIYLQRMNEHKASIFGLNVELSEYFFYDGWELWRQFKYPEQ